MVRTYNAVISFVLNFIAISQCFVAFHVNFYHVGEKNEYTKIARTMITTCNEALEEVCRHNTIFYHIYVSFVDIAANFITKKDLTRHCIICDIFLQFSAQLQQLEQELAGESSVKEESDPRHDSSEFPVEETGKPYRSDKEIIEVNEEKMEVDLSESKDDEDDGITFYAEGQDDESSEVDVTNTKSENECSANAVSTENILNTDLNLSSSDDDDSS